MVCPGVFRKAAKLVPTVVQALALVVCIHVVGQGLLGKYGSAKYRFSKSYQATGYGFGSNKVSKVIKYIDKNIPRYSPKPGKGGKGKGKQHLSTPSTTSTTPAPPPPLPDLVEVQKRRVERLRDTCVKYGIGSHGAAPLQPEEEVQDMQTFLIKQNIPVKPLWQNLICAKEQRVSICPVYKAASTFLLKKLLLLAPSGKYDKESVKHLEAQANVLARKEFGYLDSWTLYPEFTTNGTSMIFVRHPFERILSAFRDKLEDPSVQGRKPNDYYFNKHGRRIVMHYRKQQITGPTWKYPKFSEFVDYVLGKDLRYDDEHWSPYYKECTPCNINYTFVGHFETLYWDMHLLANKTGIAVWDDKTDYFQSSTHRAVSEEYFATVEREKIRKLYTRYKLDFELFGYSADDFIKLGIPGPEDIADEPSSKNEPEVIPERGPNEKLVPEAMVKKHQEAGDNLELDFGVKAEETKSLGFDGDLAQPEGISE